MVHETIRGFPCGEPLGRRQRLHSLRTLHTAMADAFGEAVSTLLRSRVEMRLANVDELTYGEFVSQLETPTCFNLLRAEPLEDRLMLDLELSILYPLIDRLLGGGDEDEPPPHRALSDIEISLAARITQLFLRELHHAWENIADLKMELLQVESNPRLSRVLPSDEMVVVIGFVLTVDNRQGMVRLCLPCRMIEQLDTKPMTTEDGDHPSSAPVAFENPDAGGLGPRSPLVEMEVTLASTSIAACDLQNLGVGDIIATETTIGEPTMVSIADQPKFHAKLGSYQGRKAIRVTEVVQGPEETRQEPSFRTHNSGQT